MLLGDDAVVAGLALIDVRDINEVEVRLPATAVILDVISKRSALNEWVLVLVASERWVSGPQGLKHFKSSV